MVFGKYIGAAFIATVLSVVLSCKSLPKTEVPVNSKPKTSVQSAPTEPRDDLESKLDNESTQTDSNREISEYYKKLQEANVKTAEEPTIGHQFLTLESMLLPSDLRSKYYPKAREVLDDIIDEAKRTITVKDSYTEAEAENLLYTIHEIRRKRANYKEVDLLGKGLAEGHLDCDTGSYVDLSVLEALGLSKLVSMVATPYINNIGHAFIRFKLGSGKFLDWETTSGVKVQKVDKSLYKWIKDHESLPSLKKNQIYGFLYCNIGKHLLSAGDFRAAVIIFSESIKNDPSIGQSYISRAIAYLELGQLDNVISDSDEAIKLNPKFALIYVLKGNTLYRQDKFEEAIECLDKAIDLDPKEEGAYYFKGVTLRELGKYDEAIDCYDKVIELDPKYAEAYNGKGNALYEKGKYDKAIGCYDKVIELDPNHVGVHNNKGNALSGLDKFEDAIKCYDKALELDPNYKLARENKNRALEKLKEKK